MSVLKFTSSTNRKSNFAYKKVYLENRKKCNNKFYYICHHTVYNLNILMNDKVLADGGML